MTIEQLDALRRKLHIVVNTYIDNLIDDHGEGGMCAGEDVFIVPSAALEDILETIDPDDDVVTEADLAVCSTCGR